jgi:hypothetical protein
MYLTTGKRTTMQAEYIAEMKPWAKHFDISMPGLQVRVRRGGRYKTMSRTISVPPNASRSTLVHEFAHHLNHMVCSERGHGPAFRACLVQVATLAYGRANRYPWSMEYRSIQKWAKRYGLLSYDGIRA